MGKVWFPGVEIIVEAALSATVSGSGVWDEGLWDTATWGPDEIWTDVSEWVRSIQIDRRFSRYLQVWESGTATVTLNNPDARFSGTNLSGPYVAAGRSMIRSLRPLRIRASYGGITYPMYRGVATSWDEGWIDGAVSIVTVPCQDVWSLLGSDGIAGLSSVGASELFGPRVHRWLDAAGYTGGRDIHVGTTTMQGTTLASRPIDGIRLTADSEGGAVYVEADGTIVGEHQYALVENSRSIDVQATFGDGSGPISTEVPCSDMSLAWTSDLVRNVISYARVGGSEQLRADPTSRAMTGVDQRETRSDLICETDAQVDQLASWFLAQHKDDEQTFSKVTLKPLNVPAMSVIMPQVLGRRVRDLVRCVRRPPAGDVIDKYCHISGIHHEIGDDWITTFDLSSATVVRQFAGSRWDHERALWGSDEGDPNAAKWFY